jgi:hypothetical protein
LKRLLGIVLTVVLLTAALVLPANAATVTSLYIQSSVDLEAVCTVTATVELYLDQPTEELRFTMPDGAKNGSVAGYRAKKKNGALVITNDAGFIGVNTFQLSWTVDAQVADNTDDTDDDDVIQSVIVTLPLQGSGFTWAVEKATFLVSMPRNFEATPEIISGYYGTLGDDDYVLEQNGSVLTGEITAALLDHEALTMQLILPTDYFTVDRTAGKNQGMTVASLLALFLFGFLAELYRRKKLRFRALNVTERVQPPENVTAGAVPFLLDGGEPDPVALLTQWAGLGYLTIINRGRSRTTFHRRMAMGNERKDYENAMFAAMFAGRDVCQSTERGFRRACAALAKPLRRYWRSQAYDQTGGNPGLGRFLAAVPAGAALMAGADGLLPTGSGWLALAIVLIIPGIWLGRQIQNGAAADRWGAPLVPWVRGGICALVLLVLGIAGGAWLVTLPALALQIWYGYATRYGGRRTEVGCELLEQLLGLRQFCLTATTERLEELQKKQPQYYYELLPYAMALGVGKRFSARFPAEQKLESPDWLDMGRRKTLHPTQFYALYDQVTRTLPAGSAATAQATNAKKRRSQGARNRTDRRR